MATTILGRARVESELGDAAAARKDATAALAVTPSLNIKEAAAYVFARAGDAARAQSLAAEFQKPLDHPGVVLVIHRMSFPPQRGDGPQ